MKQLSLPLILFLCVASFFPLQDTKAQQMLALENKAKFKRVLYYPGDNIKIQMKDGKAKFNGRIESINDSMIVLLSSTKMRNSGDVTTRLYRDFVTIADISHVYKRPTGSYGEFFINMMAGGLIGAGIMFTVGLPIDAALADQPVNPTSFAIGVGMLVTGTALFVFRKRKHKLGSKWELRVMNSLIQAPEPEQQGID